MLLGIPALALLAALGTARDPQIEALERRVFLLVNAERAYRGLAELQWDERLAREARRHAQSMANRRFFAHADPVRGDLTDRLKQARILWSRCAENLLLESGYEDAAREAVLSWMASPGHRKNILDKLLTHAGVGIAQRADGTLLIAQEFIRP